MAYVIRLDHDGIEEVLKSAPVAAAVKSAAAKIADKVRAAVPDRMPVEVDTYETDRAAAAVTIVHPGGLGMQAKYGVLTKAAGSIEEAKDG